MEPAIPVPGIFALGCLSEKVSTQAPRASRRPKPEYINHERPRQPAREGTGRSPVTCTQTASITSFQQYTNCSASFVSRKSGNDFSAANLTRQAEQDDASPTTDS